MKLNKINFNAKLVPVIISLAWPTMLEQLMHTVVQYIDTAMVGTLGTSATAAIGSTTTVNWLISSTISAIGVGFLAFISQALGAGNKEKAKHAVVQAVLTVIVTGIIFTVLPLLLSDVVPVLMQVDPNIRDISSKYFFILYTPMLARTASIIFGTVFRASGDTKTPMLAGILVNAVNVVLNFLLIYPTRTVTVFSLNFKIIGAGMGVIGAAVASAISYAVGGITVTVALFLHKDLSPKGQKFVPDKAILAPCFKVAVPNMMQRFATSLGYVVFASMINALGEISAAAHTIANTVESAFYIPGYGMQAAAATLSGNAVGAKDKKRLKQLSVTIVVIEVSLMVLSGMLLFMFAPHMMSLFSKNPSVIKLGATVLRMVAVSEPFYGVTIVLEGMLLGMGNTKIPFIFNVLGMWCIRILGTFIFTAILNMSLISAWACMVAHNLLLFVLFASNYLKGKGIKL